MTEMNIKSLSVTTCGRAALVGSLLLCLACPGPDDGEDAGASDAGVEQDAGGQQDAGGGQDATGGRDTGGGNDVEAVTHALEVADTTVVARVNRTDVEFTTNRMQEVAVYLEFYQNTIRTTAFPYDLDTCTTGTGISIFSVGQGQTFRYAGANVELDNESLSAPLVIPYTGDYYHETYDGTAGAMGPWVVGAWYDIVASDASPAFSIDDALFTTNGELAAITPGTGATVDLGSDLEVTWTAGDGDLVMVNVGRLGGQIVACASDDDGAFTIPAADLAAIAAGSGELYLQIMRVYSMRLDRFVDVVHMISYESAGHYLSE